MKCFPRYISFKLSIRYLSILSGEATLTLSFLPLFLLWIDTLSKNEFAPVGENYFLYKLTPSWKDYVLQGTSRQMQHLLRFAFMAKKKPKQNTMVYPNI